MRYGRFRKWSATMLALFSGKKHVPAPKRRVVSIVREARNEFDTARVLLACGHQIESRAQIGRATGCPKCAKERTK